MNSIERTDITAILRSLEDSHAILSAFVGSIPKEALHDKRRENFWTIAEHVAHLAEVQPMALQRIHRILDEDTPEFTPYFPSENDHEDITPLPTMEKALSEFKSGRNAIIERLSAASPSDWKRMAIHPEYRQYGLHIFARHILMHDHWHMYRMEELWLTQANYLSNLSS